MNKIFKKVKKKGKDKFKRKKLQKYYVIKSEGKLKLYLWRQKWSK